MTKHESRLRIREPRRQDRISWLCSRLVFAQSTTDWPSGNRATPPTVREVSPLGVARGATVTVTVDGLNLGKAGNVYFSEPGIKGRIICVKELPDLPDVLVGANGTPSTIDPGPLPPRNEVTLELDGP